MENTPTETKKGFFQNDRLLVCSMLAFYGLCIIGLIVAAAWWLSARSQSLSANATATGLAIATQQANATATARIRATEQSQYEFIETFAATSGRWLLGFVDSDHWKGQRRIKDNVYLWEVQEVKKTFISWANFYKGDQIEDFDVYVDTKILDAAPGDVCSGLIFRKSPEGWDEGGYYFAFCSNLVAIISYHTEQGGWERIATVSYHGRSGDWNRLEILARGDHFTFLINGDLIFEMDDNRQKVGGLALVIELNEKVPAQVLFDNFGFQSR